MPNSHNNRIDISRMFQPSSESVSEFFTQAGIGYYIPLYQREYSWDEENVEQLMEDIRSGVDELQKNPEQIHFMGTVILVTEDDVHNNIHPQDHRAIPSRIDNVIDGQQRISTIALLACCLYSEIHNLKKTLDYLTSSAQKLDGLQDAFTTKFSKLQELFSFDLQRGNPSRKPIIIRGSNDGWTLNGNEKDHYKSDVSSYISKFITTITDQDNKDLNSISFEKKESLVAKNLKSIKNLLDDVRNAHKSDKDDYPSAWDIVDRINQVELWDYDRDDIKSLVQQYKSESDSQLKNCICSIVQVFAFSSYLLNRCCFTVIRPISKIRAFDMFQSLNATGTPLTAIETFKPLVVNSVQSNEIVYKDSVFEESFTKVENLMIKLQSAANKTRRTNDFLTLLSAHYEGGKSLSKQFSAQLKWLTEKFERSHNDPNKKSNIAEKEAFIKCLGNVASYAQKIIYSRANLLNALPELNLVTSPTDREEAAFCLMYLIDANHKMSHTILSRFYSQAIEVSNNATTSIENQMYFIDACKAVAAFFTLWRSALPNKGLDDEYRKLLKNELSFVSCNHLNSQILKTKLKEILQEHHIGDKNQWLLKASNYLRFDNVHKVCKFVLFINAQDSIEDSNNPGLHKSGRNHCSPKYLSPKQWSSDDLKTIEHIAPKDGSGFWDSELYTVSEDYHKIGNLTLLPGEINSSAGNKSWPFKYLYYRHLSENDPDVLQELESVAENQGITLQNSTIQLLKRGRYAHHIKPLISIDIDGSWDKSLVDMRTERICTITWEKMFDSWLS